MPVIRCQSLGHIWRYPTLFLFAGAALTRYSCVIINSSTTMKLIICCSLLWDSSYCCSYTLKEFKSRSLSLSRFSFTWWHLLFDNTLDRHFRLVHEYICVEESWRRRSTMTIRGSSSITCHVMSCHVMSSVRMEYGLCVSSSRSHEEYAGNCGASIRLLGPMQWRIGLVVVVVRWLSVNERATRSWDRSIDRSLSVRQTIFESRHRSRIKTLHVEEEEPSFDNR